MITLFAFLGVDRAREKLRVAGLGPPVLPPGRVPSLVDGGGRLLRDRARVGEVSDPSEIRAEWAAQAERFETVFGRRPTHLDTHHHVHRNPRVFKVALDLAQGLDRPLRALTPEMVQRVRGRQLPAVDRAVGDVGPEAFWQPERLIDFLRGLPPGVTELMCHPGHVDSPLSASSYAAQRQARNLLRADRPSVLAGLAAGEPDRIDAPLVFAAAARGDPAAVTVVARAAQALGAGVAALINLCSPEMILLGGGVMEAGDILVEPLTRWTRYYAFEAAFDRTRIVRSILTKESGVLGAATLFLYERSRGRFG